MRRFVAALLVGYKRLISPLLPPACRFQPTCSEYARLAVLKYGVLRGGGRALWRIARCQPLGVGGIDLP
ncbi:MAG: membrane protein insertion efficiency factor YidD [Thermoanaerobaculia bacterium]